MRIGIFGGSFDPVHSEHIAAVRCALRSLRLDKIYIVPSYVAPHKTGGAHASGEDRLAMCRLAFEGVEKAELSDYELKREGTSYTYLTCRYFREVHPEDEIFFLVGCDMLEDFFSWKNPDDILSNVTLACFDRGDDGVEAWRSRFSERFQKDFVKLPFRGEKVSSTDIRVKIAFSKFCPELPEKVEKYILEKELYAYLQIAPALALEKPERQEHTFRVARMAVGRARSLRLEEGKVMLACALHDCAKSVPLSSPLMEGFTPPEGVPAPVMHQYAGAYLACKKFGINDTEILLAIRYHTSGRGDMTKMEKLVYLADLLEEGRTFEGVERLRKLFYTDLDLCLYISLKEQIEFIKATGKPLYSLTLEAYEYYKTLIENRK